RCSNRSSGTSRAATASRKSSCRAIPSATFSPGAAAREFRSMTATGPSLCDWPARPVSRFRQRRRVIGMHSAAPDELKISFSTLPGPRWPWAQIAQCGGRGGYDGVELRMIEGQTDLLARPEFAGDAFESNVELLRSFELRVCGLASSVRFDHLEREER